MQIVSWRQFAWNVKAYILVELRKNIIRLSPAELTMEL